MNRTSKTFGIVLLAVVAMGVAMVYAAPDEEKAKAPEAASKPAVEAKAVATDLTAEQVAAVAKPTPGWKDKACPAVVELTPEVVHDVKGDGPDGKANTDDDTWGFWFQLANDANSFRRLNINTSTLSADQKANGIRDPRAKRGHQGKVRGPIGGYLPNKADTEGWIFSSDWDGRFEGVWGDKKDKCVMIQPYVEKVFHGAVALSYRVPATGTYTITCKVTDVQPTPQIAKHDGITFWVQAVSDAGAVMVKKVGPIGDGDANNGRPNEMAFKLEKVKIGGGQTLRFVVHPNAWWGADMTRLDLKIETVK